MLVFCPSSRWSSIYLHQEPDFKISEAEMTFKALGVGHNGKQLYAFQLTFFEPVETEVRMGNMGV